jgi:hypothetical protein
MRIEIKHPAFESQRLSVETASILTGPKLLLNDVVVKRKGRSYLVRSDIGQELAIKVMYNFLDPVPKMKIGEEMIELAKPLQWFEYAWIGVGAGSTVVNGRIFRSDRSAVSKYALAAVTTVAGAAVFFVVAIAIQIAIGPKK